ncbi:unnamed protein product [Rhodiola kirilowii]
MEAALFLNSYTISRLKLHPNPTKLSIPFSSSTRIRPTRPNPHPHLTLRSVLQDPNSSKHLNPPLPLTTTTKMSLTAT